MGVQLDSFSERSAAFQTLIFMMTTAFDRHKRIRRRFAAVLSRRLAVQIGIISTATNSLSPRRVRTPDGRSFVMHCGSFDCFSGRSIHHYLTRRRPVSPVVRASRDEVSAGRVGLLLSCDRCARIHNRGHWHTSIVIQTPKFTTLYENLYNCSADWSAVSSAHSLTSHQVI